MILSILIPTMKSRREMLARLMERLRPQLGTEVVAVVQDGIPYEDGGPTIGERRNAMVQACQTPYLTFVDDDDMVSSNYCHLVMAAIKGGADVVGFRMKVFFDGQLEGEAIHRLSAGHWYVEVENGQRVYWRTPNHLNPIRSDIAKDIGYKDLKNGEDGDYSVRLFEKYGKTLKETMIEEHIYDYLARAQKAKPIVAYDKRGRLTREGAADAIKHGGSASYNGRMCCTMKELEAVLG